MNENQTTIQLLKILASQTKGKKSKKKYVAKAYPKGIENRYKMRLSAWYKPLIDYIKKFISENNEELLRGDSEALRLDAIPGRTYQNMSANMQRWFDELFPENPSEASYIYPSLKDISEQLKDFEDREFAKQFEKAVNVSIKEQADWWNGMQTTWANNNYKLIRSNASAFIDKINVLTEQAVVNGTTVRDLQKAIQKATSGLSDAKCKLLARDQIGKLQGQISQGQMEEIGLEMYIWSTSGDERVRDSHLEMEGKLCRWDDANVYSQDGGKTWIDRPSSAVQMHPGQDIQCRCVALAYFPEIESVATGEPMEIVEPEISEEVVEPIELTENQKDIIDLISDIKKDSLNYNDIQKNFLNELEYVVKNSKNKNITFNIANDELRNYLNGLSDWKVEKTRGEPWGFASTTNSRAKVLSYVYGKNYCPIDVNTKTLIKDFKGCFDIYDLEFLKCTKLNNKFFSSDFKSIASVDELPYFLRAETRNISDISSWKVGDKLDWVGVTSVSASKTHNDYWLRNMCESSETKARCRFHIKRNSDFEKSICIIQRDDIGKEKNSKKFPEDIVSVCSGVKIDKIEKNDNVFEIFVTPFL